MFLDIQIDLISGMKIIVTPWINDLNGASLNINVFGLNSYEYDGLCSNATNSNTNFETLR